MNTNPSSSLQPKKGDIHLAFDVGHSSIGWAVLNARTGQAPDLLGCGSVIFAADDCLASQRRGFRRQRRHIRATRQRISRIERLLAHLGVMTKQQLEKKHVAAGGHAAPWFLAARVLRGGKLLTWEELWDVLRWYAHNRGYDGNKAWSAHNTAADEEDTEKVENARSLLSDFERKHGHTGSMAEIFCDVSGLDPLGAKISCNLPGDKRPKALNAAFPREAVEREVRAILERHIGHLPKLDADFIRALIEDWTALHCPTIQLPARFGQILTCGKRTPGGLLFGQLVPRFENRIIATCPITFERVYQSVLDDTNDDVRAKHEAGKRAKVPAKDCPEFLRFRWAMQVANIQVATGSGRKTRSLSADERKRLDLKMREHGFFTKSEFRKAIREISGGAPDNVDQILTHPEADKALILDPARKALSKAPWDTLFPLMPLPLQKRIIGQLRRGKAVLLGRLASECGTNLDAAIENLHSAANTKKRRGQAATTREELLDATLRCDALTGRAPHTRTVMREAADFVFNTDSHPTEEGGPLYRSEAIRAAQIQRAIDEQTNNHLVRHRLLILDRLHHDILKEFAANEPSSIGRVTIEVNRDLREMSGKTAKLVAQELGQRLANFKSVAARLEKAFEGKNIRITPGLIRKARIAEDLGWKCPYTGKDYCEFDLLHRKVDKDHIIPRSQRASDSLDSLVITFAEVNRMKGKRTAARFVEDCAGQTVEGKPELTIKTLSNFLNDVSALEAFKGHDDDKRRKKRRKEMLALRDYVEKEFTPRDLTQTSQLVRLGAQMLERAYSGSARALPVITSLPGSVTGTVRKSWNLLGCLATANPQVLNPDDPDEHGKPKVHHKTEIRGITHLHHALDACVIAFTALFFPRDGGVWELIVKRRLNAGEQQTLKARIGHYAEFTQAGELKLIDLPAALKEQIRLRLAERRVVQHVPAEWGGLPTKETIWRVFDPKDDHPNSRRIQRWLLEAKVPIPDPEDPKATTVLLTMRKRRNSKDEAGAGKVFRDTKREWKWVYCEVERSKVLGLGIVGDKKLRAIKGGKLIDDNYGLAIFENAPKGMEKFRPIRFFRVWEEMDRLKQEGGGKRPAILRRGQLIRFRQGKFAGRIWRILGIEENGKVRFFSPDFVRRIDKPENYERIMITSLLRDGLEILKPPLTGLATPPQTE